SCVAVKVALDAVDDLTERSSVVVRDRLPIEVGVDDTPSLDETAVMKKEELQPVHGRWRAEPQSDRHVLRVVIMEAEFPVHAATVHARKTREDLDPEEVVEDQKTVMLLHAEVLAERADDGRSLAGNHVVIREAERLLRSIAKMAQVRLPQRQAEGLTRLLVDRAVLLKGTFELFGESRWRTTPQEMIQPILDLLPSGERNDRFPGSWRHDAFAAGEVLSWLAPYRRHARVHGVSEDFVHFAVQPPRFRLVRRGNVIGVEAARNRHAVPATEEFVVDTPHDRDLCHGSWCELDAVVPDRLVLAGSKFLHDVARGFDHDPHQPVGRAAAGVEPVSDDARF